MTPELALAAYLAATDRRERDRLRRRAELAIESQGGHVRVACGGWAWTTIDGELTKERPYRRERRRR